MTTEPPPRARDVHDLDRRLHALETIVQVHHTDVQGKLANGYESFERLRAGMGKLEDEVKPKRQNYLSLAGLVLAVGGIVFTAGTYPNREALDREIGKIENRFDRLDAQIDELRDEIGGLQSRLIRFETRLEQVDAARAQLSTLFDSVLEAARANRARKGKR